MFGEQGAVRLQLAVGEPDELGLRSLDIYSSRRASLDGTDEPWTHHASAALAPTGTVAKSVQERAAVLANGSWPPQDAQAMDVDGLYDTLAELGLEYGPVFQGLQAAWRRGDEVFAEVAICADQKAAAASFGVHPALLDSAFHAGLAALTEPALPFSFSDVELYSVGASSLRVSISGSQGDAASLVVADGSGMLVASVGSLVARKVPAAQWRSARGAHHDLLFRMAWSEVPIPAHAAAERRDKRQIEVHANLESLCKELERGGAVPEVVLVDCGDGSSEPVSAHRCAHRTLGLIKPG